MGILCSGQERVLIVAPHSDDEVLGCGGLMSEAIKRGNKVKVVIGALGDTYFYHNERVVKAEERKAELASALNRLGVSDFVCLYDNKEGVLDTLPKQEITTKLDKIIDEYKPTMVFIPYPSFHQDHKVVFETAFASLRPSPTTRCIKLVAMYEYPFILWNSEYLPGGDMYLDITESIQDKLDALAEHKSQIRDGRHLISPETVKDWARFRGLAVSVDYAEAYRILRHVI